MGKYERIELTFNNGKFVAFPGCLNEKVHFDKELKLFRFTCTGSDRNVNHDIVVNLDNVNFIEYIPEED